MYALLGLPLYSVHSFLFGQVSGWFVYLDPFLRPYGVFDIGVACIGCMSYFHNMQLHVCIHFWKVTSEAAFLAANWTHCLLLKLFILVFAPILVRTARLVPLART